MPDTIRELAKRGAQESDLLESDFVTATISKNDQESLYYIRQAENRLEKIKNYINMIGALNGKSSST